MTEQHNDDRRWRHIDDEMPRNRQLCMVYSVNEGKVRLKRFYYHRADNVTIEAYWQMQPEPEQYFPKVFPYWRPVTMTPPSLKEQQDAKEGVGDGR